MSIKNHDFYSEKFSRNGLSKINQKKIKNTVFCIIGLGGTGGVVLENLLRLGAEKFVLFDHDLFELTNFNRQILATSDSLDQEKCAVALKRAKSINPNVSIKLNREFTRLSRLHSLDIVFDCTDNVQSKLIIAQKCRAKKIPYVFCSANDTRGIVTVFRKYKFEKAFAIPKSKSALSKYKKCSRILCPSVMISASIAVSIGLNVIFGLNHIEAPEALFFDLTQKDIFWRADLG